MSKRVDFQPQIATAANPIVSWDIATSSSNRSNVDIFDFSLHSLSNDEDITGTIWGKLNHNASLLKAGSVFSDGKHFRTSGLGDTAPVCYQYTIEFGYTYIEVHIDGLVDDQSIQVYMVGRGT